MIGSVTPIVSHSWLPSADVAPLENAPASASCKLRAVNRAHRSIGTAFFSLSALLFTVNAEAGGGSRLVYGRAPSVTSCPEESELRAAVRARLGYDPFFPWADQTVVAHVAPRPNRRLSGKVYLVDSQGRASPEREFTTTIEECNELILALSLAIVIALDPLHGSIAAGAAPTEKRAAASESNEPNAQSTSPASDASASNAASEAAPAASAGDARARVAGNGSRATDSAAGRGNAAGTSFPIALDLGAGPILGVGLTPGVSSGIVPFVRARSGAGSVAIEGRYEVSVWSAFGTDRAAVTLAGGAITPCLQWKSLKGCPTLLLARYRAVGLDAAPQAAPRYSRWPGSALAPKSQLGRVFGASCGRKGSST